MRPYACWCSACARVTGRGAQHGTSSDGSYLDVIGCHRKALTRWKEDSFKVTPKAGLAERNKRLAELWSHLSKEIGPGKYGCVQVSEHAFDLTWLPALHSHKVAGAHPLSVCAQVRELWSTSEMRHYRPGHYWVFEFGDAGHNTSVKKAFKLARRSWVDFEGVRFYDGESALVVKKWLHRMEADGSGLTFVEWDPQEEDLDQGSQLAAMIVNSSELRGVWEVSKNPTAASNFREVLPPVLAEVSRRPQRGAAVKSGYSRAECEKDDDESEPRKFLMSERLDSVNRERCTADSFALGGDTGDQL